MPKYLPDPGFPRDLLKKSVGDRKAYFENHRYRHPKFREALRAALFLIFNATPGTMIYLMGPTGAGKSSLLDQLEPLIVGIARNALRSDIDRLPFARFGAWQPEIGNYNWYQHYRNTLEALNAKLINLKLPMPMIEWQETHKGKVPPRKALGRELRYAMIEELRRRRPFATIVDDAQYFARVASAQKLADVLNVIHNISKDSRATHVLTGTQELIPFSEACGKLGRISKPVYFLPYTTSKEDFRIFVKIIVHFQNHLPLPETPQLRTLARYLYHGCLGLIGMLKDWLMFTLADVLDHRHSTTITRDDLERNAFSKETLDEIRKDIKKFENKHGYTLPPNKRLPAGASHEKDKSTTPPPKRGRRSVGKRNPKHDPVGPS